MVTEMCTLVEANTYILGQERKYRKWVYHLTYGGLIIDFDSCFLDFLSQSSSRFWAYLANETKRETKLGYSVAAIKAISH